jgi:hypothetical protein
MKLTYHPHDEIHNPFSHKTLFPLLIDHFIGSIKDFVNAGFADCNVFLEGNFDGILLGFMLFGDTWDGF